LDILHLRYAVEVAHTGSINKAASNLFMGQPNLSRAIKELESELGFQLFSRTTRGVEPTTRGETFLQYAASLVTQMNELERMYKPGSSSHVKMSMSVPRASYISWSFAHFVDKLDLDVPMTLDYQETNTMKIIQRVKNGENEAGIIRYPAKYADYIRQTLNLDHLQYKPMFDFVYLAAMSTDHPLAKKENVYLKDFEPYIEIAHGDFAVSNRSDLSGIAMEPSANQAEKKIFVYERGSQFDLLCDVHGAYMWISPLPNELLHRYKLVTRKPVDATMVYHDTFIFNPAFEHNEILTSFLTALRRTIETLKLKTYH
jgi:DNA-binding transcriptional LysR family regulator